MPETAPHTSRNRPTPPPQAAGESHGCFLVEIECIAKSDDDGLRATAAGLEQGDCFFCSFRHAFILRVPTDEDKREYIAPCRTE